MQRITGLLSGALCFIILGRGFSARVFDFVSFLFCIRFPPPLKSEYRKQRRARANTCGNATAVKQVPQHRQQPKSVCEAPAAAGAADKPQLTEAAAGGREVSATARATSRASVTASEAKICFFLITRDIGNLRRLFFSR